MRLRELASKLGAKPGQLRAKAIVLGLSAVKDSDDLSDKEEELLRDHWHLSNRELRALKRGLEEDVRLTSNSERVIRTQARPSRPAALDSDDLGNGSGLRSSIKQLEKAVNQLRKSLDHQREQLENLEEQHHRLSQAVTAGNGPSGDQSSPGVSQGVLDALQDAILEVQQAVEGNAIDAEKLSVLEKSLDIKAKAIEDLDTSVSMLSQQVADNRQEVVDWIKKLTHNINLNFKSLGERIGVLETRVSAVDAIIQPVRNQIEASERHWSAIAATCRLSQSLDHRKVEVDLEHCNAELARMGLFYPRDVLHQCLGALRDGRPLLLTGSSGTGKSSLARALPPIVLGGTFEEVVTQYSAEDSWTGIDLLGGTGNGMFAVKLGVFPEAVSKCVTSGGRNWLLIDELNRADVDSCFSGLMEVLQSLSAGQRTALPLHHLSRNGESLELRIPDSFRLICTMNHLDHDTLIPISQAFLRRFQTVEFRGPDRDTDKRIASAILDKTEGLSAAVRKRVQVSADNALEVLATVRALDASLGFAGLDFGAHYTSQVVRTLIEITLDSHALNSTPTDLAMHRCLGSLFSSLPGKAIRQLLEVPFAKGPFPLTHESLLRAQKNLPHYQRWIDT